MSAFTLVARLAFGELVSQAEALDELHRTAGAPEDAARLDRVARIHARSEALRDAADELGGVGIGAWELAGRLESAISRFESRVWPRLKAGFECELCPSDRALYRAFLTGQRVPRTQRRLYDLIA